MLLTTKFPLVNQKFYQDHQLGNIDASLNEIDRNYGEIVDVVSQNSKIPKALLTAMIFIESEGKEKAKNKASGAIGLMQITLATATDQLHAEIKKGRLTPQERAYIVAQVGEAKMACVEKMQYMGHKLKCNNNTGVVFTEADLFKPELNIAIGAIFLGQLIDKHTEGDQVRIDKVVINYNRGAFAKVPTGTPEQVYKLAGNLETRNYIAKLAGVNGVMTRA